MLNPVTPNEVKPAPVETWSFSGPHSDATDKHMQSVLAQRALAKFKHPSSLKGLLLEAKYTLREAGHWRDEARIDADIKGGNVDGRCSRLLHGIPSPRFWRANTYSTRMPAIDIVYFFTTNAKEREDLLLSVSPTPPDREALSQWLADFTSRTFQQDLIATLCDFVDYQTNMSMSTSHQHLHPYFAEIYRRQAMVIAAEIDRYAWYRGYRTMNLAKAASVWAAELKLAPNRRSKQNLQQENQ